MPPKTTIANFFLFNAVVYVLSGCGSEAGSGESPDLTRFNDTVVGDCPLYTRSAHFRDRQTTTIVYPESDWIRIIERVGPDTEVLLADGDYLLDKQTVVIPPRVTIRGMSGDRDSVRISGLGYDVESEGFMINGNDITIADLSISNLRDHAVAVNTASLPPENFQLYNVDLKDIGTQHVKVNPGGASDGLIACSNLGYSENGAVGDYNGAIDLHQAIDWTVRDNYIYNIAGDGSGCNVDQDCGNFTSAPAILVWNNSQGTRIIGNVIVDSYRNIALGLGTSHVGGEVTHNIIVQSSAGDAGIELFGVSDLLVEFNTVKLSGSYPGVIEYRDSNNLDITNNWLSRQPWDRGGNDNVQLSGNAY